MKKRSKLKRKRLSDSLLNELFDVRIQHYTYDGGRKRQYDVIVLDKRGEDDV